MQARFLTHRFAPHTHDTWAIGAVIAGAKDDAIGRHSNIVRAGELNALRPGQAHAGRLVGEVACHYAMVYVNDEMFRCRADTLGINTPTLPAHAIADQTLAARLAAFVARALANQGAPSLKDQWISLFDDLLLTHGASGVSIPSGTRHSSSARLQRARNFLREHWDQSISLQTLAESAALSPFHFCRRFAQEFGLSPHRYQLVMRMNRAKALIERGADLAEVAQLTGFADQSHLGRQFKSCFGFTPGHLQHFDEKLSSLYLRK